MLYVIYFWFGLGLSLGLIDVALASCTYSLINIPAVFLSTNVRSRSQSD